MNNINTLIKKNNLTIEGPTISVIIAINFDSNFSKLKKVLYCLQKQTYMNLEIVVVGNAVSSTIHSFLCDWGKKQANAIYLPFKSNEESSDGHSFIGRLRYQVGIDNSTGDLIFCQSDNDLLAPDFFSRMARLFLDNPECVTAIGLPVSYYWDENRIEIIQDGTWKERPKYMGGLQLVLRWIKDINFRQNLGFCFVVRKELYNTVGEEIWYNYDTSALLSLVSQGITGFDPDAIMYWGHNSEQAHFELSQQYYLNLVEARQFNHRNKLALRIWNSISKPSELHLLKKYLRGELKMHSVKGFFKALFSKLNNNSISCSRHMIGLLLSKNKFILKRLYGEVIRYIKKRSFHYVRFYNDPGIDVTFIEYKNSLVPPNPKLYDISCKAVHLLNDEWQNEKGFQYLSKELYCLFDYNNHYLLLTAIARAIEAEKIVEIGTAGGASLWSWLRADNVKTVDTWDIRPLSNSLVWLQNNECKKLVTEALYQDNRWIQHVEDISDPEIWLLRSSLISDADIIFLDASHSGTLERKLLSNIFTLDNKKEILLIFDDIKVSTMVGFFESLNLPKLDITGIGHQSGTGLALLLPEHARWDLLFEPNPLKIFK